MKTPTAGGERLYQPVLVVMGHLTFLSTNLRKRQLYQANNFALHELQSTSLCRTVYALAVVLAVTIYDLRIYRYNLVPYARNSCVDDKKGSDE